MVTPAGSIILHNRCTSCSQANVCVPHTPWPSPLDRNAARGAWEHQRVYVHVLLEDAYQLEIGLQEPGLTNLMTYFTKIVGPPPELNEKLEDVLHEVNRQRHIENRHVRHPNG